ncbi:PEP/pyruvate-binding domain-containing protein, partial [Candidatus Latescibacterota bacterium]
TGKPVLDDILQMIRPGDNLVWQVDTIEEYIPFVESYAADALKKDVKLVYFRFAAHRQLLKNKAGIDIHRLDPDMGFETFTTNIRKIIKETGSGAYFVFDCLSDLPVHWYSDLMLGNFFVLICPYVYNINSLAYFALFRNHHSLSVASRIRNTTQIFIDTYYFNNELYIHPLKVDQRHSPTMYLPHVFENETFRPVTDSGTLSEMFTTVVNPAKDSLSRVLDVWDRTFIEIQTLHDEIERGIKPAEEFEPVFKKLLKMLISRDERVLNLALKYFTFSDILYVKSRLIGTGFIGGKSVGMLLSRAILNKSNIKWAERLEVHDSYFIGSDVFYTYIVLNGCWDAKQKQHTSETLFDGIDYAHERILNGEFPEFILQQFVEMFDSFGQSPIIVRSSSLLEDNFGNAFSGKYESVFCVNQGTRDERFEAFLNAVRRVYASTMSKEALTYRDRRGLLNRDEQMALLVQRVSGAVYDSLFYPQIAGVGLSFNPYVWNNKIDPESGMLRLVCGLGTRAVDRQDDDYTRIVALNEPSLSPEKNFDKMKKYAQRRVDVLDLYENILSSRDFDEISKISPEYITEIVGSKLNVSEKSGASRKSSRDYWMITFEKLFSETEFIKDMRQLLKLLQTAYDYPVDTEFTVNFRKDGNYKINLVQCRPLQMGERGKIVKPPEHIEQRNIILKTHGAIIGPSLVSEVERIIYVVPSIYGQLPEHERFALAQMIGRITHLDNNKSIMLMGPGRWGTSMASLGVPIKFADINNVSIICELVEMNENLIPDVSLGTHFFNDIVETQMLYLAVFPNLKENFINRTFLEKTPNKLTELLPGASKWANAINVIDTEDLSEGRKIILNANTIEQDAICYLE